MADDKHKYVISKANILVLKLSDLLKILFLRKLLEGKNTDMSQVI